ncbi:MAG TPA: FUSC family membrane protein [Chitinophagaceae bacterium]|nr:FUSC family membrane protein [Chitinophagaceae bacterium]
MFGKSRDIKQFLFSQYLADGIRITIAIVIPSIIYDWFGDLEKGLLISIGALCVSICDVPGPVKHRRNGMFYCNVFGFIMALLTGLVSNNTILLGTLIIISSFFFSMLSIYGNRSASVGTAALLVMILRMTTVTGIQESFTEGLLILAGGTWYMVLALVFNSLNPYRPAQRSLGECIRETAKYLRIKAALYDTTTNVDDEYKKLVSQQVVVNEKQEQVRELLFKNRAMLKESISSGRLLVLTFADLVDLYEQILAGWYNYNLLREKFSSSGILNNIAAIGIKIADELDNIAYAIQSKSIYKKQYDALHDLNELKDNIDRLSQQNHGTLILKKILVNLRDLNDRVNNLSNYFTSGSNAETRNLPEYWRFVSHQQIDATVFRNNLTMKSSVFRHSLRVMVTCMAGYIISKIFPGGHHSYWILLTIIVILKPGYGLTKQRNRERFLGTLAGGIIGVLLLAFIHDRYILLAAIIIFMTGTYTFQRMNYIVMVIFMTPYLLILFSLLGAHVADVAKERLLDTAIGSALSLSASYLLFPRWESDSLVNYMAAMLKANLRYFYRLAYILAGKKEPVTDYKLVRKEVFLSSANLSGAFNRMLSEPKTKQLHKNEIYEFVALNNVLSSNIAGMVTTALSYRNSAVSKDEIHLIRQSVSNLQQSIKNLDINYVKTEEKIAFPQTLSDMPNPQLAEQLDFVYKLTVKINKDTALIFQQAE